MKITRRKLGAAVMIAPIAPAVLAQTPPSAQPPIPANPEAELAAMKEQNKRYSEVLDKIQVPMAAEPAFQFKA